ncbi:hypothetical protein PoB_005244700 [Plakobranchus ocellatus]|uniref:Uncharacterized protein n=1 Tax=Plakobranchus ocellatus TaxID=259542 RepID=A0AAV4C3K4_9GAST|nr:hypothetical protein PoB_005244700 [Plakobranchus ocellatus]
MYRRLIIKSESARVTTFHYFHDRHSLFCVPKRQNQDTSRASAACSRLYLESRSSPETMNELPLVWRFAIVSQHAFNSRHSSPYLSTTPSGILCTQETVLGISLKPCSIQHHNVHTISRLTGYHTPSFSLPSFPLWLDQYLLSGRRQFYSICRLDSELLKLENPSRSVPIFSYHQIFIPAIPTTTTLAAVIRGSQWTSLF